MKRKEIGSKHRCKSQHGNPETTLKNINQLLLKYGFNSCLASCNLWLKAGEEDIARIIAKRNNVKFDKKKWNSRTFEIDNTDTAFEELLGQAYLELIKEEHN
jgi:hypothetical protein